MLRNIRVLFAISFLQGLVFYASIATLYRRAAGLNMFEITAIESISMLLSLALEIPWGMTADRIGYRKTMVVCSFLFLLSKIVFWRAQSFGGFLLERILLAVVCAGISGVDASILIASCSSEDTHRVFSWYSTFGTCGLICASMAYSLLIGENYRLAALLTVLSYGVAAILSLLLQEIHMEKQEKKRRFCGLSQLFDQLFGNKRLMMLTIAFAIFAECVQLTTVFLNQLQYERCGWSAAWIGAAHVLSTVIMLLGAASAKCAKKFGEWKMGAALMLLGVVACMLLAFTRKGGVSLVCLLTISLCGALMMPLAETIKNRMIDVQDRATALSVLAVFSNGTAASMEVITGWSADISLTGTMLFCALLCMVAFGLFIASKAAA